MVRAVEKNVGSNVMLSEASVDALTETIAARRLPVPESASVVTTNVAGTARSSSESKARFARRETLGRNARDVRASLESNQPYTRPMILLIADFAISDDSKEEIRRKRKGELAGGQCYLTLSVREKQTRNMKSL